MHFLPRKHYVRTWAAFTLILSLITNYWSLAGFIALTPTALANTLPKISEPASSSIKNANENSLLFTPGIINSSDKARASQSIGRLPMSFEVNAGQADSSVKFMSRGSGFGLFLLPQEMVLFINNGDKPNKTHHSTPKRKKNRLTRTAHVRIKLQNANPNPDIEGLDPLPGMQTIPKGQLWGDWISVE